MITQHGGGCGDGFGSGSGAGIEPMDERMLEFILSEITRSNLDQNPMIFVTIKYVIMEILDERLGTFCTEMSAIVGARILFRDICVCGAP